MDRGKAVINPPQFGSIGVMKPYQLQVMKSLGLPMPASILTNSPAEALEFARQHRHVIYKPAMGGAGTGLLDEETLKRIESVKNNYVIFQEYIPGDDVRVYLTRDGIISSSLIRSSTIDFREDPLYTSSNENITPVEIPPDIQDMCMKGLKRLGLEYSAVDLRRTPKGEYFFFEFNLHPAFLFVEEKTGVSISGGLTDYLLKVAGGMTGA
jgi:glutathione synthase/RimK-type ligase-like ATP-grasp enzyme